MKTPIQSKRGDAFYDRFELKGDTLHFVRIKTGRQWSLDLKQLYKVYKTSDYIDTTVVKTKTGRRVSSPSVAILMAIKCIDNSGYRIA
ncbi:MAG TPA: hypothetical protein VFI06_12300 [Chitinophagaceae bacterium]|nr:hypothetical protein [Chitinophagaceae bacterium]